LNSRVRRGESKHLERRDELEARAETLVYMSRAHALMPFGGCPCARAWLSFVCAVCVCARVRARVQEHEEVTKIKNVNKIQMGKYIVETWYAPTPLCLSSKSLVSVCLSVCLFVYVCVCEC
jgi:hypothetical protein